MEIIHVEKGQIPLKNLTMTVKDGYGRLVNVSGYTSITARMLGSDNEEVDLTGLNVNRAGAASGRIIVEWPRDRSLFTKRGDYVLQLVLETPNSRDYTKPQTIRVSELGKVIK